MSASNKSTRENTRFLKPGEFHFHNPAAQPDPIAHVSTLLGSCVSIIIWHPVHRVAAMSHIVLPGRNKGAAATLDSRYCDEVVMLLVRRVNRVGLHPDQFHAYVIGGGRMLPHEECVFSIGARNVKAAQEELRHAGFFIRAEHVGRGGHRKVHFDLARGSVIVEFEGHNIHLDTLREDKSSPRKTTSPRLRWV